MYMPFIIQKFLNFINEEFVLKEPQLVSRIKSAAATKEKRIRIPYHLEDHSILALVDDPNKPTKIFAELVVKGENICLEYGDLEHGIQDTMYNHNDYDNIADMLSTAYTAWKSKMQELELTEEDISIDIFQSNN